MLLVLTQFSFTWHILQLVLLSSVVLYFSHFLDSCTTNSTRAVEAQILPLAHTDGLDGFSSGWESSMVVWD